MHIIRKHCKKSDSWLHCYFVAHDGFGLKPRLKTGFIDRSGLYFYFLFTFWRFEIYRVRPKNMTMSKAEKFISDYTRNCSNEMAFKDYDGSKLYHDWLTPLQALCAVKIAREEVIEWIDNHWREYVNVDADGVVCFGHWKNDLIKAMKDE